MKRVSNLVAGALITALAFTPGWALAQGQPAGEKYGYGPGMMWWDGGGYGMFFGPLFMILTLVVVIAAIVLLVQWLGGGPWQGVQRLQQMPPERTPLDILKERYARGEIDKKEFEERRKTLAE
jgi:putative membrane protein